MNRFITIKNEFTKNNRFTPMTKKDLEDAIMCFIKNKKLALSIFGDMNTWDVSKITDMSYLFMDYKDFNEDISNWDVSNVTNMNRMFCACPSFNQDISSWDVSKVTDMKYMFYNCIFYENIFKKFNRAFINYPSLKVLNNFLNYSPKTVNNEAKKKLNNSLNDSPKTVNNEAKKKLNNFLNDSPKTPNSDEFIKSPEIESLKSTSDYSSIDESDFPIFASNSTPVDNDDKIINLPTCSSSNSSILS